MDVAAAIFDESLRAILDEIRGIRAGKVDTAPHSPVTRIAWLAQRASSTIAEQRKVETARRKRDEELTLPQVVAWLRAQAPEDRARVARELSAMERRGGVLG